MKRGGDLKRYTPLQSSTPLGRKVPLPRSALQANTGHHSTPAKAKRKNTGPSTSVLRILNVRSEGRCEFWRCADEAAHTHHRRPRRMGGSTAPDTNQAANLLRLCPAHHDWVESERLQALQLGLLLHAGVAPASAPVLLRYGRVLLDNDGTWTPATTPPPVTA